MICTADNNGTQKRTRDTVVNCPGTPPKTPPPSHPPSPVREEIVEGADGVISSVVVPDLVPVAEDAMEEESSVESPDI